MKKLVIDLGHGGNDSGAIGKEVDVFNHFNGHEEIHISVLLYI